MNKSRFFSAVFQTAMQQSLDPSIRKGVPFAMAVSNA